jgi:hypothetical protein
MPTQGKLDTQLETATDRKEDQVELVTGVAESGQEKDDTTRQRVALLCVVGYFAGLLLILLGVPFYNYIAIARADDQRLLLDLKDTLLAYQAIVGTLVGAVVAYYFKSKLDSNEG